MHSMRVAAQRLSQTQNKTLARPPTALHRFAMSTGSAVSSSELIPGPRAAVCVIGNEVLSGKTQDTNTHFIAKFMFRRGIDLVRVVVIPDELETISSTVKQLSELVGSTGYVITTGGIGPTHDDITYEGVAHAFGKGVKIHQPTLEGLTASMVSRGRPASDINDDRKRMALLPEGCKILATATWVPIAVVENVYVLPGIPRMVKEMLEHNEDHFQGVQIHRAMVHTLTWEGDLASALSDVQRRHPNVAIGSYLNLSDDKTGARDESYNTRLTIDGRNAEEVEQVAQEIATVTQGFRFEHHHHATL